MNKQLGGVDKLTRAIGDLVDKMVLMRDGIVRSTASVRRSTAQLIDVDTRLARLEAQSWPDGSAIVRPHTQTVDEAHEVLKHAGR
jgi:hypothetical protein